MRQRHGAVIVRGNSVISMGVNTWRNDPSVVESDMIEGRGTIFSTHAEVAAIKRAGDRARGATLYVARLLACGTHGNSRPCQNCARAITRAGIKKVVYT